MTWIKLDDKSPRHPKVASLTDRAFRWWIKGLCYASEFLTNGVLHPVFWKEVPKQSRAELTGNKLWDWDDPNFIIHDYLSHQSSKEAVSQKKSDSAERVARYRERVRNGVTSNAGNAVGNAVTSNAGNAAGNALVTPPDTENREQRTDTENRTTTKNGAPRLIVGGAHYARLLETHAFVGSVLRVPKVLHAELLGKSGGAHREPDLESWYLALNEELETKGEGTGDVFAWLRPRHQAFAVSKGWIAAAPRPAAPQAAYRGIAAIMADAEAKKAGAK